MSSKDVLKFLIKAILVVKTSVYRWSRRLVTCDEDVCLHMDHVDGVRPDVQPIGGDVLPVLSHKRGNKAHLQQKVFILSVIQKIYVNLL
jgi:hypothetical protein